MNLSDPMSSVITGVPGVILSILARTDQPLTGLTVAKLAGHRASAAGVTRAMRPLVEAGLVDLAPAGRAHLYSLNREHVAYPAIAQLAGLRAELYRRISDAVARWSPPAICVGVFGSTARGHAGPASDIDLLIVRPDDVPADDGAWARQVVELSAAVARWAGNGCEVLEYDGAELRRLHDDGEPVLRALEREVVVLHGVDVRSMLATAAH